MRLNESPAFENANIKCKMILGHKNIISVPMDKWILHTINVETFKYITEV